MTLAFMAYGIAVAAFAAAAAWLIERAQVSVKGPRRFAWAGGIAAALLLPPVMLSLSGPATHIAAQAGSPVASKLLADPVQTIYTLGGAAAAGFPFDRFAKFAWLLASVVLFAVHAVSAWRLTRRARHWASEHIDGQAICVAPDIGPAVFGWLRPRVIFPRWLMSAPEEVRRLTLAHEAEHLAVRDPQLLSAATLLAVLFPWNFPLLWMLRRLRFAMEVDCDARVLRTGVDPNAYGLALLYVSERQARSPVMAIALIERTSQLERRINVMLESPRKWPALIAGTCLALAASCLYAATKIDAPSLTTGTAVLKPPPGVDTLGFKLGQRFEVLLREKYPELLDGALEAQPIVLAVLNDDWTIERSAKILTPEPIDQIKAGEDIFGILGMTREEVGYIGAMNMQRGAGAKEFVLMLYTERKAPGERFRSKMFPDTRALDRGLYAQNFRADESVAAGLWPWVLLDRAGNVLRSGFDSRKTDRWDDAVEHRFPGIDAQEVTVTEITDAAGEPLRDAGGANLQLVSVWLAPGSAAPGK